MQPSDPKRESLRWIRSVDAVEEQRADRFDVLHVTDAEGDFFELLADLVSRKARFVIRAGQLDRIVDADAGLIPLRDAIDGVRPRLHREVPLSERRLAKRDTRKKKRNPPRASRTARLAIGATRVSLRPSKYTDVRCEPFIINVVRVWEPSPPTGEQAVEWVLLTTEDVSTRYALARVIDTYRMRWTIEEYFKALKSGCSLEKRQIESYEGLRKVLAIFAPIACRLLLLRSLERSAPKARATTGFSKVDLHLLAKAPSNRALPPPATLKDALTHVARLGGHLRNNGPPGWLTLARGYEKLLTLRLGWELARAEYERSDQS